MKIFHVTMVLLSLLIASRVSSQHQQKRQDLKYHSFEPNHLNYYVKTNEVFLPQETLNYQWSDSANDWKSPEQKITRTYALDGKILAELYELPGSNPTSVMRLENKYDNIGQLTATYRFFLDPNSTVWDTGYIDLYKYDFRGSKTEQLLYSKWDSIWHLDAGYHYSYAYNTSYQPTVIITQIWYQDINQYQNSSIDVYMYKWTGGKVHTIETKYWNFEKNIFENHTRSINIDWHKWNGTPDHSLWHSADVWTWDGQDYSGKVINSMDYDERDNLTAIRKEIYKNNRWTIDYLDTFLLSYNSDGALVERIWQSYSINGFTFYNQSKQEFSNFVTYNGLKNDLQGTAGSVNVYPNPIADNAEINVQLSGDNLVFKLFDLCGTALSEKKMLNRKCSVEKGNLSPGIYIYRIYDGTQLIGTGKIAIQ
jgi:hypothetical protein